MKPSELKKTGLDAFFEPGSIAIIGSFREGGFGGYVVVKSLMEAGYEGKIFPVNPGYREVLQLKVYPSLSDIGEQVDMAIVMINARNVVGIIEECGRNRICSVVVVADGFAEKDEQGARLQTELVEAARRWGVRVIGPNTAGIINSANGLNPCPYDAGYYRVKKGPVTICSQTGMINPQAYAYPELGFGINKICDLGNKCDVDECDMLEYLENDDSTGVISIYLESISDGKRFLEVARRVSLKKPVLALKVGTTSAGAQASASHTGSLAVDDAVFGAACSQAGLLRIDKFSELFELPKVFACQPLPSGNRVGVVSFTGGVGVLAVDEGARYGLVLADFSGVSREIFKGISEDLGKNPVDLGPMIPTVKDFSAFYGRILKAVLADDNVDSLFNVVWADALGKNTNAYLEAYEEMKSYARKPVVTWVYGPNSSNISNIAKELEDLGFPVFREPETCIKAIGMLTTYAKRKRSRSRVQG
ncbi:MAG TPA: hypothetical protein HPP90_04940 [Deltaproteobacteria bacterium]|nr:hypothetical protein [Deltaproteobacteria bacterium]